MVESFNDSVLAIIDQMKRIKCKSKSDIISLRRKFLMGKESDLYVVYNGIDIKLLTKLSETQTFDKSSESSDPTMQNLYNSIKICYEAASEDQKKKLQLLLNDIIKKYNLVKPKKKD
jgi:hypothetical protein